MENKQKKKFKDSLWLLLKKVLQAFVLLEAFSSSLDSLMPFVDTILLSGIASKQVSLVENLI